MQLLHLLSLAISMAAVNAVTTGASPVNARPFGQREVHTDRRANNCVFTNFNQLGQQQSCQSITIQNMAVPAGQTLDLTKLKAGTTVTFAGQTTFGYKEWEGPLISISGDSITVNGASGHLFNCQGERWWDSKGDKGKKKPKFFSAHNMQNSFINGLSVKNTPVQAFSIFGAHGLTVNNVHIDNKEGDTKGAHNTDGFDVGGSNSVHIFNPTVYNQDDCLAINSGVDVIFQGAYCSGGHGISIGSVGGRSDNVVKDIYVAQSTIADSVNAMRIKTIQDQTGQVSNVTYTHLTLNGVTSYAIQIEQDYYKGGPSGHPTTGVPISDVHVNNFQGTLGPKAVPINIVCGKGSCTDFRFNKINLKGGDESRNKCKNAPDNLC